MRRPRASFLFLVLLVLGLSLTVPAEDPPETAYDESEAQPYERTPFASNLTQSATALVTQAARIGQRRQLVNLCRVAATRINGTGAHRYAEPRTALSLLCTLLC